MRARRLRWAMGVAMVVALLVPVLSLAAAPRYIVAHGGGLDSPRVLADWEANLRLLTQSKSRALVPPEHLADREYVELAFFWGPAWAEYAAAAAGQVASGGAACPGVAAVRGRSGR